MYCEDHSPPLLPLLPSTPPPPPSPLKVPLIQTIADIYRSIHFHRNAALYTSLAASQAQEVALRSSSNTSAQHYFTVCALALACTVCESYTTAPPLPHPPPHPRPTPC